MSTAQSIEEIIAAKKAELDVLHRTLEIIRGTGTPTRTPPPNRSRPRDPVARAIVEAGTVLKEFTIAELHQYLLTTPQLDVPTFRTFRWQVSKGMYDRQLRKIREERRGNTAKGRPSYIFTVR